MKTPVLILLLLAGVSAGRADTVTLESNLDRWMYPFNGTPGTRASAGTFGAFGSTTFDERDAQFLVSFNTGASVAPGQGAANYLITNMRLTLTVAGGDFAYDGSPDDYRSYLDPSAPIYQADTDAGRPVELFGVGYRNGFSSATFAENSAFGPPGPPAPGIRNAFALGFDGGLGVDASNPIDFANNGANGFNPTVFSIGQSALSAGDAVPVGTVFTFDQNLGDANVLAYLQGQLNAGKMDFIASSLHAAAFGGPATYPIWHTREAGSSLSPKLEFDVTVIPEPGTLVLLGLSLFALLALRGRR